MFRPIDKPDTAPDDDGSGTQEAGGRWLFHLENPTQWGRPCEADRHQGAITSVTRVPGVLPRVEPFCEFPRASRQFLALTSSFLPYNGWGNSALMFMRIPSDKPTALVAPSEGTPL
jgi:hypothetical protein